MQQMRASEPCDTDMKYIDLAKPNTIDIYNKFMGGVDKAGHMIYFTETSFRGEMVQIDCFLFYWCLWNKYKGLGSEHN